MRLSSLIGRQKKRVSPIDPHQVTSEVRYFLARGKAGRFLCFELGNATYSARQR